MVYKVEIDDIWFDINSDDVIYCKAYNSYGMQCNFNSDTEEYDRIKEICEEIADKFRELRRINNESKS